MSQSDESTELPASNSRLAAGHPRPHGKSEQQAEEFRKLAMQQQES